MLNKTYVIIILIFISYAGYCQNSKRDKLNNNTRIYTNKLHEIDGPYVYGYRDSISILTVEQEKPDYKFYILKKSASKQKNQQITCNVNNSDKDNFTFTLRDHYKIPFAVYKQPRKLFVISDIEGNFNAFYGMLIGNNIMDKNYNWIFGEGHLVICGDMVDRGNNAWPCLWLLYKLEKEAEKVGGKVHYILGNHDVMNMHANLKYVKKRHIELAKIFFNKDDDKEAWLELLSNSNEIVKWISTKNSIEKIGDNIYLHGGISTDVVDANLSLDMINNIVRKNIRKNLTNNPEDNKYDNLIFSKYGPLWYRGLVKDYKNNYKKITKKNLNRILKFYNAKKIIIGHTIVDDEITSDFNGKIIRIGIKHPSEKFNNKSQGLLIKNNQYFKVFNTGEKHALKF